MVPLAAMRTGVMLARNGPRMAKAFQTYGPMALSAYNGLRSGYQQLNSYGKRSRNSPLRQTKRKKQKKNPKTTKVSFAGGHNQSSDKKIIRKTKKLTFAQRVLKQALPEIARTTNQVSITSQEGQQGAVTVLTGWTYTDLNTYAANSLTAEKRFYIDSIEYRVQYSNVTSVSVKLTIYDLQCKDDGTALTTEPVVAWQSGLSSKYNNNNQIWVPHMTPQESSNFKSIWRVLSSYTITLAPGEQHEHYFKQDINKYYDSNQAKQFTYSGGSTYTPDYAKGFTHACLARVVGSLVTDDTKITFGVSKVISVSQIKYKFRRPQGSSTNQLVAVQNASPQNGLSSEKYMNEDTGNANTNTQA